MVVVQIVPPPEEAPFREFSDRWRAAIRDLEIALDDGDLGRVSECAGRTAALTLMVARARTRRETEGESARALVLAIEDVAARIVRREGSDGR
jgi:hypothetical protein